MPRFYFDLHDDQHNSVWADKHGLDLPDLQSVRVEALETAKELIMDALLTEHALEGRSFVISDGGGNVVLHFQFEEALRVATRLWR